MCTILKSPLAQFSLYGDVCFNIQPSASRYIIYISEESNYPHYLKAALVYQTLDSIMEKSWKTALENIVEFDMEGQHYGKMKTPECSPTSRMGNFLVLLLPNPSHDVTMSYSLPAEGPEFDLRSTHARTSWDPNNAFPWGVRYCHIIGLSLSINIKVIGQMVWPWVCWHTQTHTHKRKDCPDSMTSTAEAGGNHRN